MGQYHHLQSHDIGLKPVVVLFPIQHNGLMFLFLFIVFIKRLAAERKRGWQNIAIIYPFF